MSIVMGTDVNVDEIQALEATGSWPNLELEQTLLKRVLRYQLKRGLRSSREVERAFRMAGDYLDVHAGVYAADQRDYNERCYVSALAVVNGLLGQKSGISVSSLKVVTLRGHEGRVRVTVAFVAV